VLYDEIDIDDVSNGVIVLNGLEETELVICAVFVALDEDDTDKVADDEPDKDAVPEIEEDSETEYVDEGVCEINGDTDNDNIEETEGLEEGLTSTEAESDSKLDGVTEVVETNEFDAMEADCKGDNDVDKVAEGENVFVKVSSIEMRDVKVETTVVVAVIIEFGVTDGGEESEASKLTLCDDEDEM